MSTTRHARTQRRVLYGPAGDRGLRPRGRRAGQRTGRRCGSPASSWPPGQADRHDRSSDAPRSRSSRIRGGEPSTPRTNARERDQARAPYRAPHPVPIHISRLSTRGKTQLDEVLGYLNGSGLAPDRIFGVYRVPERISQALTPHSEKGRPVEWDIVHSDPAARRRRSSRRPSPPTSSGSRGGSGRAVGARRGARARVLPQRGDRARALRRARPRLGVPHAARRRRRELQPRLHARARGRRGPPAHRLRRPRAHARGRAAAPAPARAASTSRCSTGPRSPRRSTPASPTRRRCRRRSRTCRPRRRSCCARTSRSSACGPTDCYSAQATADRVPPARAARTQHRPQAALRGRQGADARARLRAASCSSIATAPSTRQGANAGRPTRSEQLQARLERATGVRRRIALADELGGLFGKVARAAEAIERLHWDNWFEGDGRGIRPRTATAGRRSGDRRLTPVGRHADAPQARLVRVLIGLAAADRRGRSASRSGSPARSTRAATSRTTPSPAPRSGSRRASRPQDGVRYTVYVIFGGAFNNSDRVVGRTGCQTVRAARASAAPARARA